MELFLKILINFLPRRLTAKKITENQFWIFGFNIPSEEILKRYLHHKFGVTFSYNALFFQTP